MRSVRSLALGALIYGGCLGVAAVTPVQADAQVIYSGYDTYGTYYGNPGVYPAGFYNYNYVNYPLNYTNWGGNTTPSGYPQWYVNYVNWNTPYNSYQYPAYNPYRGYRGRRW